jgi:hypothetical protein
VTQRLPLVLRPRVPWCTAYAQRLTSSRTRPMPSWIFCRPISRALDGYTRLKTSHRSVYRRNPFICLPAIHANPAAIPRDKRRNPRLNHLRPDFRLVGLIY